MTIDVELIEYEFIERFNCLRGQNDNLSDSRVMKFWVKSTHIQLETT